MCDTIFSIAQINSVRNDYKQNIDKHMEYIKLAAQNDAKIIIFPELSIIGYERELAKEQYFIRNDSRLDCLKKASVDHDIIIVAGSPLLLKNQLYISSLIFTPTNDQMIYTKKYLHPGEELYFSPSAQYDPDIIINGEQLSFAICYDIEKNEHIKSVKNKQSNYYVASIFYSKDGIQSGLKRLQYLAKEYSIAVFMSNYVGTCWDMEAGGCSSIWSRYGDLVVTADTYSECLLVARNNNEDWKGKIILY
jgi:predicted amidohydrolase